MKNNSRLGQWQIVLIVLGVLFVFGPAVWDMLTETFTALADIQLEDIFTRAGMFVIGVILLAIVGVTELVKEFTDKPKSKHIK